LQNERVKAIRALMMRKTRRQTGLFMAEGVSVLVMARDAGFVPKTLVYNPDHSSGRVFESLVAWALETGCDVMEVSEAVLGKLSSKDNPQAMIGVFEQRLGNLPDLSDLRNDEVWLALEEVRDPGNLGTIIRTIDAVGARGVILVGTCCDPYSREAVRATMGSVFHVSIVKQDHDAFLSFIESWPGERIGGHLCGREDFRKVSCKKPVLILMGAEGPGLTKKLNGSWTKIVKIPMSGNLDLINLSLSSALMLYHFRGPYLTI